MIETAMSRRAVLTGAAIAGMALPTTGALGAPEPVGAATDGSADVIVIGAGLAGLSAARHLQAQRASVSFWRRGTEPVVASIPSGWVAAR